jgi:ABC-type multidrug transport system fused ATPase/permease subunit
MTVLELSRWQFGITGAGKSTLAAGLFRFVDLSSGAARLNGRDLAGYDPDDVRAVISDAELTQAASDARLLDWITSLPRGWDTPAGAHGAALSGGTYHRLWQAGHQGRPA